MVGQMQRRIGSLLVLFGTLTGAISFFSVVKLISISSLENAMLTGNQGSIGYLSAVSMWCGIALAAEGINIVRGPFGISKVIFEKGDMKRITLSLGFIPTTCGTAILALLPMVVFAIILRSKNGEDLYTITWIPARAVLGVVIGANLFCIITALIAKRLFVLSAVIRADRRVFVEKRSLFFRETFEAGAAMDVILKTEFAEIPFYQANWHGLWVILVTEKCLIPIAAESYFFQPRCNRTAMDALVKDLKSKLAILDEANSTRKY